MKKKNENANSINCNITLSKDDNLKTIINIDYDRNTIQLTNQNNNEDKKGKLEKIIKLNVEINFIKIID